MTTLVTATDFCRNFGKYWRRVQREPICIQSYGKTTGYFVSPEEYGRFQRLLTESRKAYHPSKLPDHLRKALEGTRMGAKHKHLNKLLVG